jgi:hypothetical protein
MGGANRECTAAVPAAFRQLIRHGLVRVVAAGLPLFSFEFGAEAAAERSIAAR